MADSILRLKVESAEYDSKLKKASQGLQHYIDNCRKAGGTLAVVEDNTLAFVKALGEMPTVAQGGTQSLREMTRSLTDLTMQYRSLTDEEKNSPFGQAMAASIQTLTDRAGQARDAIDDVNATIKHAASDTRVFDQIAGAVGLTTASFQTLQGASKLLGVDLGDNVEVIAKLQAAMAVTNGLTQVQNALQKESAIMQGIATVQTSAHAAAQALLAKNTKMATAAGEAFNAVSNSHPYVLLASAIVTVVSALVLYSKHQKQAAEDAKLNEEALQRTKKATEDYRNTLSSEYAQMMTKYDSLKRAWLSLADTHQKQQWINENKKAFEDLGLKINTVKGAEDVFENNTGKVIDSFRRRAEAAAIAARMVDLYRQKMDLQQQAEDVYTQKRVQAYYTVPKDYLDQVRKTEGLRKDSTPNQWGETTYNNGRFIRGKNDSGPFTFSKQEAEAYNNSLKETDTQLKSIIDEGKKINSLIDESNNRLTQLQSTVTTIKGGKDDKTTIIPTGSIADLTQKLQDLKTAQSLVTNTDDWVRYQQQIKHVEYQINALKGEWERGLQATFDFGASEQFKKMADAGREMLRMFGDGNVDLLARPMVDAAELVKKGWKDAGDGIATVFSYQRQIEDSTGRSIEILVTPILPDGTVLSEDELNQYIDEKIWGANDILGADDKGILIKVGASEDGSMGETLHDLQAIYYMTDKKIDLKVDGDRLKSVTSQMADYIRTGQLSGLNLNDTIKVTVDDTEALAKLSEIQGVTIADKTVMVTAHNAAALAQLAQVEDVTLADKSVTVTAQDKDALTKLSEIQGITIDDKNVSVSVDSAEAYNELLQLSKDMDGTTVTFNVKPEIDRGIGKSITTSAGLNDFISDIKAKLQDADFGSDLYRSLTEKLADATMLENLVKESLSVGLGTALFDIADETGQDFWDRVLSPEGVENADWQAIADAINRKRKEIGLEALTLDFNTGNISTSKVNTEQIDISKQVVSGLAQVSNGLNQMGIQIPDGLSKAIGAMQGLKSVIEGLRTITEVLRSSTIASAITSEAANTSAITANTTAVMALTAAMATDTAMEGTETVMTAVKIAAVAAMNNGGMVPHAAQGYAVPGTHYSGDTTPIMANAGELILNRAQQGNLATQLEDSRTEAPVSSKPYVTGQDIYLGLTNYLIGAGMGQLVTTKSMKN